MKLIQTGITRISNIMPGLSQFLTEIYEFPEDVVDEKVMPHLNNLRDDLYVFIEEPYVDKVYRDSYYTYFSSKHSEYKRDCVRLAFFSEEINDLDFRDSTKQDQLKNSFLGFLILRPTYPQIVGRSVINPKALKGQNFNCCICEIEVLVNGIKLKVKGFPHSSQDTETITCAETTLWSIMEYFGYKYAEYKPVLPSEIIQTLAQHSYIRQIPSSGLRADQISYALKMFGFGVRIYSKDAHGDDFKRILNYYVDSGIPIIVALSNKKVGHAVIYIGYEKINTNNINDQSIIYLQKNDNLAIIDFADISKRYVIIDDNYPPYQKARFETPVEYYCGDLNFDGCELNSLIVPLYQKIHLEALVAREFVIKLLNRNDIGWNYSKEVVLRLFLTSSRSYKSVMCVNSSISEQLRELIINSAMPRFIWVAEITDKANFLNKKVMGIMLIDATATNANIMESLILIVYPDRVINYSKRTLQHLGISSSPFDIYINNLKGGF